MCVLFCHLNISSMQNWLFRRKKSKTNWQIAKYYFTFEWHTSSGAKVHKVKKGKKGEERKRKRKEKVVCILKLDFHCASVADSVVVFRCRFFLSYFAWASLLVLFALVLLLVREKKSSKKQPENLELEMNRFIKFSSLFSRLQTKKKEKGTS